VIRVVARDLPDGLGETGIPANLFHLFDRQIERLGADEQQVLGAASVSGMEFSPALIAAVQGVELPRVEACCERLVAAHLVVDATPHWSGPERRATDRYRFRHALQRRLPAAGLRRLHRRIGECKEASYAGRGVDVVAELAAHFERGGDIARALRYLAEAARHALQRAANLEAIGHLQRALALLASLPASVERDRQELELQAMLAMPPLMTQGYTAPAVRQAFSRAFELTERVGSTPELFSSLFGLFRHALVGGDMARAHRLAEQMLQAADQEPGRPRRATACLAPRPCTTTGANLRRLGCWWRSAFGRAMVCPAGSTSWSMGRTTSASRSPMRSGFKRYSAIRTAHERMPPACASTPRG